jgi:hypothetical protein
MKRIVERDNVIINHFNYNKIATIEQIKAIVGSTSTMTIYRALSRLNYLSSYSHRGKFYTLPEIPIFNQYGIWSYRSVMFSQRGNLLETAAYLVQESDEGFTASELESLLDVEVKHALLNLLKKNRILRAKVNGIFVYVSTDSGECRRQTLLRQERSAIAIIGRGLTELLPDEFKAGIILFFSLLDEKQRRLYAGLEAAKLGHGGDRKIAEFLGLDPHTVSKGRQELFGGSVDRSGIRNSGGGRKRVEKKLPK